MNIPVFIDGNQEFALIILNHSFPIQYKDTLKEVWNNSSIRLCSDGGANRIKRLGELSLIPDFILGDFDSVQPETLDHFKSFGKTEFIRVVDNETSDAEKCIQFVIEKYPHIKHCVLYGFAGGIIDKELNCYHLMVKYKEHIDVIPVDEVSFVLLLASGNWKLQIDLSKYGPRCGIIPLFGPVRCTTTGLQWNLCNELLEMGKQISTSNLFNENGTISIECNNYTLFTCQIQRKEREK